VISIVYSPTCEASMGSKLKNLVYESPSENPEASWKSNERLITSVV